MSSEPLRNISHTAERLGVTEGTLRTWISTRRYKLPFLKVGRLVKFRDQDIDAWLETREVK